MIKKRLDTMGLSLSPLAIGCEPLGKTDWGYVNIADCKRAIKKANKLMGQKGRILVRKSGTEPKIRVMAESYDKSLILKCIKIIKNSIK